MSRLALALAAVAGVIAAAWYAARARARAAPELAPRSTEDVIREESSSGVARWRAGVVRAVEAYRSSLEELTTALPQWSDGPEALRVASILRDAASVESTRALRFRAWFVPSSPAPSSRLVQDAGTLAVMAAAQALAARELMLEAIAREPLELAPELSSSSPPAELTPGEAAAASSSSSSSSGASSSSSSSSSSSPIRTNAATRSGIVPLPRDLRIVR